MRPAIVPAVLAALLAAPLSGCGDRASNDGGQGNAVAAAPTGSPDEAAPTAPAPRSGGIDTSHKGEAAPVLGFVDPAGKPVTLAAWRGKPVLLNLWATWCGPCVKELPTLDTLAERTAGKLAVVTLSQDMDPAKVAPFFAGRKFRALKPYTDPKMAWVPAVANNLPTSILYDAQGKEVWRTVGDLDWTGPVATEALAKVMG